MTTLSAVLERSIARAVDQKEERAKAARTPRQADLGPVVQGWRGTEPVALFLPRHIDRDQALIAARAAAVGFGCDIIAVTSDGWAPTKDHVEANPVTGEDWGPGEMQALVEEHQGIERGIIREALTTIVVNRAGDVAGAVRPYLVSPDPAAAGRPRMQVAWEEGYDQQFDDMRGVIPSALHSFMAEVPADILMARAGVDPADFGLDAMAARAHFDCAVVKALLHGTTGLRAAFEATSFEGIVMLLADDPARAEVIERSLGKSVWRIA